METRLRQPPPLTALCLELLAGNEKEVLTQLQQPQFDINAKTSAGYSLVYYAIKTGSIEVLKLLITQKANLKEKYDGLSLRDILKQRIEIAKIAKMEKSLKQLLEIDKILAEKKVSFNRSKLKKFSKQIIPKDIIKLQSWISYPMQALGFQYEADGYCLGASSMAVQALVLSKGKNYKKRWLHFKRFQNRLSQLIDFSPTSLEDLERLHHQKILWIEQEKEKLELKGKRLSEEQKIHLRESVNKKFTEKQSLILDIPYFLNGVEIYQQLYKHKNLLKKNIHNQDLVKSMALTSTPELEKQGGLAIVDLATGVYNFNELLAVLDQLKIQSDTSNRNDLCDAPVVLEVAANRHVITIAYDPVLARWIFFDPNKHHEDLTCIAYFSDTADMMPFIMSRLIAPENQDQLLSEIKFFSTGIQAEQLIQHVIQPVRESQVWINAQQITAEKLAYQNNKGDSWEREAFHRNDAVTLDRINHFKQTTRSFLRRNIREIVTASLILTVVIAAASVLSLGILPALFANLVLIVSIVTVACISVNYLVTKLFDFQEKKLLAERVQEREQALTQALENGKKINLQAKKEVETAPKAKQESTPPRLPSAPALENSNSPEWKAYQELTAEEKQKFTLLSPPVEQNVDPVKQIKEDLPEEIKPALH